VFHLKYKYYLVQNQQLENIYLKDYLLYYFNNLKEDFPVLNPDELLQFNAYIR